jgi:homoserine O-acetyltransferase/O-succinyltransferase
MFRSDYYSEADHGPHEIFELGNYRLESGITLPNARIAYKTHGKLNAAKDNAVLFPHMWSGTPKAMEIFIGEDRPLDPRKYFIILPGQFANGFSSSPSNTPPPLNGGAFPNVTIGDDVVAQHRLITERYEITRLELVLGWSRARELLAVAPPPETVEAPEPIDWLPPCPCCGGRMTIVETFGRWRQPRAPPHATAPTASSTS